MKKLLLPFVLMLTGCPRGENLGLGEWKHIYIGGDNICFTVKKEDVLTRYLLDTNAEKKENLLFNQGVNFSYPNTCFKVGLERGVIYNASYALGDKNYRDAFIIDNDGRVIDLGSY